MLVIFNLVWRFDIGEVADHDDGLLLAVHGGFNIVGDLLVFVPRPADVPDHVAILLLAPDRDVSHVDVGLHGDDPQREGNQEGETAVGPGQAVIQVTVLVITPGKLITLSP